MLNIGIESDAAPQEVIETCNDLLSSMFVVLSCAAGDSLKAYEEADLCAAFENYARLGLLLTETIARQLDEIQPPSRSKGKKK